MSRPVTDSESEHPDFRVAATAGVAFAAVVLLLPFAVNNFVQARPALGLSSLTVLALTSALALQSRGPLGRHRTRRALIALVPLVTVFLVMAIAQQGVIGLMWSYPAVLTFYCMLDEPHARAANALLVATVLAVAFARLDPTLAMRAAATLLATSVFAAIMVRTIERQQAQLRRRAETDPLTGLSNRHGLEAALRTATPASHAPSGARAGLMVVDLDHFKRINDEHGHAAGDAVLRAAGAALSTAVGGPREGAFRIGGEEFLLLLAPGSDEALARRAEAVRRTLERVVLPGLPPVTASVGTALARPGEATETWLERADAAVYRAKRAGRNRVAAG